MMTDTHSTHAPHAPNGGRVARYLAEHLAGGPLHMTLIDPATSSGSTGVRIAERAAALGTHAIMVGGSTDVTQVNLDELVLAIKDRTHLPVIYFPSSAGAISRHVDAIYFLSTLNSRSPRYLIGEQARGAPFVKALGIEALGMGYIIVEPGMKAGAVSEAELVKRDAAGAAHARDLALAAQYFGM
ncbi:MAG: geranylgeranylglyceryl/heptaprenylglyceryl phosphate synthase, partial [Thermoplasmatota archaeon]